MLSLLGVFHRSDEAKDSQRRAEAFNSPKVKKIDIVPFATPHNGMRSISMHRVHDMCLVSIQIVSINFPMYAYIYIYAYVIICIYVLNMHGKCARTTWVYGTLTCWTAATNCKKDGVSTVDHLAQLQSLCEIGLPTYDCL